MKGSKKHFIDVIKGQHNKQVLGKPLCVPLLFSSNKIIFSFVIFTGLLNYSALNKCRQPHTNESAKFFNYFFQLPSFFKLSKF